MIFQYPDLSALLNDNVVSMLREFTGPHVCVEGAVFFQYVPDESKGAFTPHAYLRGDKAGLFGTGAEEEVLSYLSLDTRLSIPPFVGNLALRGIWSREVVNWAGGEVRRNGLKELGGYCGIDEVRNFVFYPIQVDGRLFGGLYLANVRSDNINRIGKKGGFDGSDLRAIDGSLERFRNACEGIISGSREMELKSAEEKLAITRDMLASVSADPNNPPLIKGVKEMAYAVIPQDTYAGDAIILFETFGGIIDVMGHGLKAAYRARDIYVSLRTALQHYPAARDIGKAVASANNLLFQLGSSGPEYATGFFWSIDEGNRSIHMVNAGHPSPFGIKRNGEIVEEELFRKPETSEDLGHFALGPQEVVEYPSASHSLLDFGYFFAFTDGVYEAMDYGKNQFGRGRVRAHLEMGMRRGEGAKQILNGLFSAVEIFRKGRPQSDDIGGVGIRLV